MMKSQTEATRRLITTSIERMKARSALVPIALVMGLISYAISMNRPGELPDLGVIDRTTSTHRMSVTEAQMPFAVTSVASRLPDFTAQKTFLLLKGLGLDDARALADASDFLARSPANLRIDKANLAPRWVSFLEKYAANAKALVLHP